MKFAFLFLKIVLSTRRQTVKTLMKSRSLLFAKVHDKERVVGFTYRTKMEPSQKVQTNNNVVCATSKGSDLPAHTRSMIREHRFKKKSQTTLTSRLYRSDRLVTAKFMILLYATNGSACTSMPSKDYCGSSSFKQFRSGAGHITT